MSKSTWEVLLVEDNMADAELTVDTFADVNSAATVHHVTDGEDALAFLRREGKHMHAPAADLVLLDLNLPRKNGREVLSEIKSDRNLKLIPVIILSSSTSPRDILNSYDLSANCYLHKAENLAGFHRIVSAVNDYWLVLASLPSTVDLPAHDAPSARGRWQV